MKKICKIGQKLTQFLSLDSHYLNDEHSYTYLVTVAPERLFVCLFVTEVTCTATSVDGLRLRKGATTRELGQSPRNMSAIDGK